MRLPNLAAAVGLMVGTIGVARVDRPKPKKHLVTIEGMRFLPEMLIVAPSDMIVRFNRDLVPHTATSMSGSFDSKDIQSDGPGNSRTGRSGTLPTSVHSIRQ